MQEFLLYKNHVDVCVKLCVNMCVLVCVAKCNIVQSFLSWITILKMDKSGFESCISKTKRKDSLLNTQICASFKILCPYVTSFIYTFICFHQIYNLNIFIFLQIFYTSHLFSLDCISFNFYSIDKIIIHCLFTYSLY